MPEGQLHETIIYWQNAREINLSLHLQSLLGYRPQRIQKSEQGGERGGLTL